MICPVCSKNVPDDAQRCPFCGSPVEEGPIESDPLFCEGCGARLPEGARTCPKCGRPAPGILSASASASDLAAGKTASFPRLTDDSIASSVSAPSAPQLVVSSFDPSATNVLDADAIAERERTQKAAARREARRFKRGHVVAALAVTLAAAGGIWFVAEDPMGVMPGFYSWFESAASDMFPSREVPEGGADAASGKAGDGEGAREGSEPELSDETLGEDEAFDRLTQIYDRITGFQDEIGAAVTDYNGFYIANDRSKREEASKSAYRMRDNAQAVIDELDGLKLADDTAYAEDVEHLKQLAGYMYNRADVLCRSWDISLGLPEGEVPSMHEDEILQPLRDTEMVNGKSVDVIEYEQNVGAWKPQRK